MGQDFYESSDAAKRIFDVASEAIGEDMKNLCFTENSKLNLTEYTQPAILTTEIAMLKALEQYNFKPSLFAGHSLGEYSALVAAEVMDFQDAVKIVKKRGQLMQAAVPEGVGAMAALLMDDIEKSKFKEITLSAGAEIANYNSTGQVVISGKSECIKKASELLQKEYPEIMRIVELQVSAPFHSSLMKGIEPEFKAFLGQFQFKQQNSAKVLSNFKGTFHKPEEFIDNMVSQISGSVDWIQNMRVLNDSAENIFEVGPNKVLSKFFSTIGVNVPAIINERSAKKTFMAEG